MIARRALGLSGLTLLSICLSTSAQAQSDESFEVRIRLDETVRGLISPIAQRGLTIAPDKSFAARELASRAPPGRAGPVILILVGALALTQIAQLVNELVRQYYYGGVVIDGRKSPPEISNDPRIPANMVFVFASDGGLQQFKSGELPANFLASALKTPK
jgi:hypothetical protein